MLLLFVYYLSAVLLTIGFYEMIRRFITTLLDNTHINSIDIIPQISSNSFKNENLESLSWLHGIAPCFPIRGESITIISEPQKFYEILLSKCTSAKKRITFASLYLGVGQLEQDLVSAMKKNLENNSNLQINVLLDFTRGTRGIQNSQTTLHELIKEKDNFCLSLYHTPALRGFAKKFAPPRWNELLGLQHMKLYLFDNTIIISGANLSNDYFSNRQDRYVMIEDKSLADFYCNFIGKVQEFSLKVNHNNNIELHPGWNQLPYHGDRQNFVKQAKTSINSLFSKYLEEQTFVTQTKNDADTWIFPLVEMGQLNIHHDSYVTKNILSSALKNSKMKFATGYFNLTEVYMNTLTNDCKANCNILMAHPNANGFQGAKGIAGGIPAAYSLIAQKFHEKLVLGNQHNRVTLFEYEKPGWTYHAKGLWYYLPNSVLPNLTLIGSSNFGERSVNRDLETQLCIVTENKELQIQLQAECDNLYKLGKSADSELIVRPIPRWVRTVVWLFKNFF